MKVLIGYDGSDSARDAIEGLGRAGLPQDSEVIVVSAADVWPQLPQSAYDSMSESSLRRQTPIVRKAHALAAQEHKQAQALAAEGAEIVRRAFPRWKVSGQAFAGSPSAALVQPTGGTPDLVVVGSQGRSGFGRLMLGSVSHAVLNHAACSVRISRRGNSVQPGADSPVRIIVGVDGSVHSALAVSAVASRSWPAGTEVKVIAALDLKFLSALASPASAAWATDWTVMEAAEEDEQALARRAVGAVAEELRSVGLLATPLVAEGNPKRVLLEEAERWKADGIFVGAKGHSRLERFLLGSVSAAVAARASCSVEVVRQG
jgi:nucleotide-binding universal stress UspA family protein